MNGDDSMVRAAGTAAVTGGVLGVAALGAVILGETTRGADAFMESTAAQLAGWASFAGAGLLAVGLMGVAVRYAAGLSAVGRAALLVLGFATAVTAGAMGTLALVVPALADRAPALAADPPAAVPATFILSGFASGICALVVAVGLRRSGAASRAVTTLLMAGAVVSMAPLPSRFFLLALAVGVLLLAPAPKAQRREYVAMETAVY